MHSWVRPRRGCEGAAELEVDVLDPRVSFQDSENVADPGDFLRVVALGVDDLDAGAAGEPAVAAEAGVVDDEVQVGPVFGGFFEVERAARFFVEGTQGQALVDAEVLDPEGLGLFPERIGDFFVIHAPGFFADLGAGVHLPGVDLQFLDLPLHLFELGLAEVGAKQAVRKNPARPGEIIDELARGDHLVGRQRVLVPIAAGDAADDGHDGVAIAEDFLDVMCAVEQLDGLAERLGPGRSMRKND